MTHEEWINVSEEDMKRKAREIARYITFRIWDDGNSHDETFVASEGQADVTYGIIMAAMLAYGRSTEADLRSILNTAEYAGHFLYNTDQEVNCYDTIYIPLQKAMGEWS